MASKLYIRRYTNIASCLDILATGRLTLLRPDSWDDKNDREYIELYRKRSGLSAVYAMCFTEAVETYHHWKVFAADAHGVCMLFEADQLRAAASAQQDVELRNIKYVRASNIYDRSIPDNEMPYTKQYAYRGEEEVRLLGSSVSQSPANVMSFKIDTSMIAGVQLSPWLPDALVGVLETAIRAVDRRTELEIEKSKVIENSDWTAATLI